VLLSFELLLQTLPLAFGESTQYLLPLEATHVKHSEGYLLVLCTHEAVLDLDLI